MGCLSKKKILDANDLPREKVFVPEWADGDKDAYVIVRALTAKEQDDFDKLIFKGKMDESNAPEIDTTNYRAKRAIFCLCDDEGQAIFTLEDLPALSGKSAKAMQRVLEADQRLNGKVREKVKNSEPALVDSSPSV